MAAPPVDRSFGDFSTIAAALEQAATSSQELAFWTAPGARSGRLSYRQLRDEARRAASRLSGMGYSPGDRIGLIAETGRDFLITFYACQYAGLIACPLASPIYLGGKDHGVLRSRRLAQNAGMAALIGPENLMPLVQTVVSGLSTVALSYRTIFETGLTGPLRPLGADDAAYIQYSSGSTAEPKGVLITQRAVNANARGILQQGLEVVPEDRCVSWLPLYHDMGLFGFSIAPMFAQVSVDYMSPPAFARRPASWLELISATRATISFAPSFAYKLAGDRVGEDRDRLDLSSWRIAGVGADMIPLKVLDDFTELMKPTGFRKDAFLPSYGMAESVLGVSFTRPSAPFRTSRPRHNENLFVSCGKPFDGHDIAVVDEHGKVLGDGAIGRVWIRGPSIMKGYFADPVATEAVRQRDGFIDTGDLGFKDHAEIFITGRSKEVIKINGRSLWPQDVEWITAEIAGLGIGDAVAFDTVGDAGVRIVLLIKQSKIAPAIRADTAAKLGAAINSNLGIMPDIIFVPSRFLPRTPSGKIARNLARQLFEASDAVSATETNV